MFPNIIPVQQLGELQAEIDEFEVFEIPELGNISLSEFWFGMREFISQDKS